VNIRYTPQYDFSLGVQDATTFLLKQPNELRRGINLRFSEVVGAFERRPGFIREGSAFATNKAAQGAIIAKFSTGSKRIVAVNNSGDTATILRVQANDGTWSDIAGIPTYPKDAIIFFKYYLDEVYVSGFDPLTGDPIQPINIDKTLNVSTTRNLMFAPHPYFFEEYLGVLYAANVMIGANRYKDRVYKSSPPLGPMTYMQGAQENNYASETLVNQIPAMTAANAPSGAASASTFYSVSGTEYPAWRAFTRGTDYGAYDRWLTANTNVTTGWLQYDFGSGNSKVIKSYSITAPGPIGSINRSPKTWTFEGSNDASSWTTLHTVTNEAAFTAVGEKRMYVISNTTAYRYYRINITANQGNTDPSRIAIAQMEMFSALEPNRLVEFKVDTVRYVRPGMIVEVYDAGKETKKFTVTVNTIDKSKNTFTVFPIYNTTGSFNSTTDIVTFSSALDATEFPTGTPIRFTTTGAMPTGLIANQSYYVIRTGTSTEVRLATTKDQAQIGNYINFTSNGSGTFTAERMYSVNDNDEIWLVGTKGRLNLFWNTDYPDEQTAEFLTLKPGTDAAPTITGIGASSNRLFIFTKNSGTRYDGSNLITFNHSVGCVSQRSIANIDDDWLIWMDAKGNIRARNESQGAQENISRAVRNRWLRKLTSDQMKAVSIGVVDQVVKIYLGTIGGENIRLAYDFEANTWSPERLAYPAIIQDSDDVTGVIKPYFFSSNGRLYMDEVGDLDDDKNIAFEAGTGKDNLQTPLRKRFYGITFFTRNANGLRVQAAVDGGQMQTIGRIEGETCFIQFPESSKNILPLGVSIDWQIMGVGPGEAPVVEGAAIFWTPEEDVPR